MRGIRYRSLLVMLGFLLALAVPNHAEGAEFDLLQKFDSFALREPPDPPPPGGPRIYSVTSDSPNWFVSQWNIPGEKLSPFVHRQTDGTTVFEAHAPAADVRILIAPSRTAVILAQNGSVLPCLNQVGRPREFDLFISPGKLRGRPSTPQPAQAGASASLSELTALVQSATVAIRTARPPGDKNCTLNKGNALLALILHNTVAQPKQTLFYQLALNRFCGRASPERRRECDAPPRHFNFFSTRNPFGVDDMLPLVGEPFLAGGESRVLRIDLLPRLKDIIASAPAGMDPDVSHWVVDGAYAGQHIYGDVILETEWSENRLIAFTRQP
jgi:hypothetical protein